MNGLYLKKITNFLRMEWLLLSVAFLSLLVDHVTRYDIIFIV